jgi:hypothetical protein
MASIGLGAMMAAMWWRKTNQPDEPERPLRDQLLEARDKVRRQIEICRSPAGNGASPPHYHREIADLEAELGQLEEALANLGLADV